MQPWGNPESLFLINAKIVFCLSTQIHHTACNNPANINKLCGHDSPKGGVFLFQVHSAEFYRLKKVQFINKELGLLYLIHRNAAASILCRTFAGNYLLKNIWNIIEPTRNRAGERYSLRRPCSYVRSQAYLHGPECRSAE